MNKSDDVVRHSIMLVVGIALVVLALLASSGIVALILAILVVVSGVYLLVIDYFDWREKLR